MYPRPAPGGDLSAAFEEPALWTATPIAVGDRDLVDLNVPLRTGIRAHGRVEFSGGSKAPTGAALQRISVRLQVAEGRTSSPIALDGRVNADGTFKTAGYAGGRYIASALASTVPPGWHVRSIMLNGRDVSVEPFELGTEDVRGLVVTFTDRVSTLAGVVSNAKGPDPTAEVVVFPADTLAWKQTGVVARRHRVERVDARGAFTISGLPPGEYFVAAVPGSLPGDRHDPGMLASLAADATRAVIADGGSVNLQLVVKR
jgi:hypothetical protein